jgi:hypothetical protein
MASVLKVNEIQHTGGTSALTVNSSGNVSLPQKIAFMAKITTNFDPGTAARTKIPFATNNSASRVFNFGNGFDDSNNRFQAPIDGLYFFMATAYVGRHTTGSYHIFRFTLNDNAVAIGEGYNIMVPSSGTYQSAHIHCYVNLTAGDTIDCRTQSNTDASYDIEFSNSHFSGHFIG